MHLTWALTVVCSIVESYTFNFQVSVEHIIHISLRNSAFSTTKFKGLTPFFLSCHSAKIFWSCRWPGLARQKILLLKLVCMGRSRLWAMWKEVSRQVDDCVLFKAHMLIFLSDLDSKWWKLSFKPQRTWKHCQVCHYDCHFWKLTHVPRTPICDL